MRTPVVDLTLTTADATLPLRFQTATAEPTPTGWRVACSGLATDSAMLLADLFATREQALLRVVSEEGETLRGPVRVVSLNMGSSRSAVLEYRE